MPDLSTSGPNAPELTRYRRGVAVALVFSLLLFAPLVWHVRHSLQLSAQTSACYLAAEQIRDDIIHRNHALSVDALARVARGGDGAQPSRRVLQEDMNAVIARAGLDASPCGGAAFVESVTTLLHDLRRIEDLALALGADGRIAAAHDLLVGSAYRADLAGLERALGGYVATCSRRMDATVRRERREEIRSLGLSLGLLAVSGGVWIGLLRRVRQERRQAVTAAAVRKAAVDDLNRAIERYDHLFRAARDGIILIDAGTERILDVNTVAAGLLGYRDRDLIGHPLSVIDLGAADGTTRLDAPDGDGEVVRGARRLRRRDGSVVEVCIDSSIEGRVDAVLQWIVSTASERDGAKDRPDPRTRGLAHDLSNLLVAIRGYVEIADRPERRPMPPGDCLARIREATEQGLDISRSLVTFAGDRVSAPQHVDVHDVVAAAVRQCEPMLAPGVAVELAPRAAGSADAHADPASLRRAVVNLVLNASEAMPGGGRIGVAVARFAGRSGQDGGPRSGIAVRVHDDGPGLPPAIASRLWEPFATTKADGRHLGLGLYNVRRIVTACGGRCEVETGDGTGTTFTLLLPAAAPHAAESAGAAVGATVLLCEPDRGVRELLTDALRRDGLRVIARNSGRAATAAAGRTAPDVAVVPVEELDTELMSVLERVPGPDRVILTQPAAADALPLAGEAVRALILPRPFTADELGDLIHIAIGSHRTRTVGT